MSSLLQQRVNNILANGIEKYLLDSQTGIEKESLRASADGNIAQTPHPDILGSALKNPIITTDYSESLLELITPPCKRAHLALDYLQDIETFVYQHIGDELLWTTSMPCIIRGEDDIQIAQYGSSNAGKMKSIYREGLAVRYGKLMQVIAGIHFNYSVAPSFWQPFQELEQNTLPLQEFINQRYMGMTRNILRYGWLIPYLFGTSPAICKTFLKGVPAPETMQVFNENTLYEPYGTSLRMGDIGYTNKKEDEIGVKANYNNLQEYIDTLRHAINTSHPDYEALGLKRNGEYQQLNTNILQIENEYYSSVRPKQILHGFEKPTLALDRRGIEYVELRSVDINAFHPAGMTRRQLYFLETFMMYCFLNTSPALNATDMQAIENNQSRVTHQGRKSGLTLNNNGKPITLKQWGNELLNDMQPVADLLNQVHNEECYSIALNEQLELIQHPELTPSAKVLDDIMQKDGSYYHFARRKSEEHRNYYLQRQLDKKIEAAFELIAQKSLEQQHELEKNDTLELDEFLTRYFNDTL